MTLLPASPQAWRQPTRDVAEVYHTIPLHPSQWPAGVIKISETMGCIDTNLAFRSTLAAGTYGHMADACCEIFCSHGIGLVNKWVDDHIFFRVRMQYLNDYNNSCCSWHQDILAHTPRPLLSGGQLWHQGWCHSDSSSDEFNENCSHPLKDFSNHSLQLCHIHTFPVATPV